MSRLILATGIFLLVIVFGGWAQVARISNPSPAFYTGAQAQRGKALFAQHCSTCHTVNRSGSRPLDLAGAEWIQEWYSVADLFSKTYWTMPADNVLSLSEDAHVDLVAYLLQVNGLPAGNQDLPGDVNEMRKMVLTPRGSRSVRNENKSGNLAEGYYSSQQAKRGRLFFLGSCGLCHAAEGPGPNEDPTRITPASGTGMWLGSQRFYMRLAGDRFTQRYHTVGDLFNKIRTTMPAYDGGGLSPEMSVDIVAYLLEANGFPAGEEDLSGDSSTMKAMPLVEKGFQRLFNGKDFGGFQFVLGHNCAPRPSGCGHTDPGTTFQVERGTIFSSGRPLGYMYTEKKYLNFTLRFDYRYLPNEGMERDDDFYGNSGYLLFITKNEVWPKSLEIQGSNSLVLSVIPVDSKAKFTVDDEARKRAIHPVGQWNSVEIVSKDGQVGSSLNGTLISIVSEHEFREPGYIGFQSEGAKIYWRNIRMREE